MKRRSFLKNSSLVIGAFTIVPRHVLGGPKYTAPSDKLYIAAIGAGGQAAWDLEQLESENIIALCDVDWERAADSFKKYPKANRYKDFRVMLDREKSIDAVLVATPDHTHAVAAMAAIKRGKHVYCEKPLTHTVYEARMLAQAAKEAGVATQMGNQGMAFEGNRLIKEWLADGAIGTVREVHVWSDRPTRLGTTDLWWAQGIERPKETPPVPPDLDWDLWLGPAPFRPYHPAYVPFAWRGWWDFGEGGLGDMGIHNIAPAFDALKLTAPISVHASSTPVFPDSLPVASIVHYEFPAVGDRPAVKLHWYDGGLLPERPKELEDYRALPKEDGLIFIGDKGAMLVEGWGGEIPRLIPETRMREYRRPPKTLPRSIGHHAEWIRACKEGTPTASHFGFAGPLTETVLIGTICVRLGGRKLHWDAAAMRFDDEEANRLLHYEYRAGWEL
ncbi:MAG: Gfo/Idh/MocA family oxidoreductase [candidate division KSB1 bacterium]|nr:Gfo/Idh/MocA family oxidoreductase [candidate division KSB1 bacterium]